MGEAGGRYSCANLTHDCTECSFTPRSSLSTSRGGTYVSNEQSFRAPLGMAIGVMLAAAPALTNPSRINHITTAVRLRCILLTPGTNTFQAGPQGTDLDIVRLPTRDDRACARHVAYAREAPTRGPMASFGEAPAGSPQPIPCATRTVPAGGTSFVTDRDKHP